MWDELLSRQHGVLTREQVLALGVSRSMLAAHLRAGRWRRVAGRVYATFTGPLPRSAQLWAVVLRAGPGAVLSHETAAELVGLTDQPSAPIAVSIPAGRRLTRMPGVRVHVSGRLEAARHPSRVPPQTRVEETVLDLVDRAPRLEEALGWVTVACSRRRTTPARLRAAMSDRTRLRWRAELLAGLTEVAEGCHSVLEVRYRRQVERLHGLPTGARQSVRARRGGRWYDDVHYRDYRTRVELDGQVAHPLSSRLRDMRRDNAAVVDGDSVLRYGWSDVTGYPCGCAVQVAQVLVRNGWIGAPRPCGPECPVPTSEDLEEFGSL